MSFFPADYNPRDDVLAGLDLVAVDTPDGILRFIIGTDAVFTDLNGDAWYGSQMIGVGNMESAINGVAPEGSITLSFFQDPDAPSLIDEIKSLGVDYIAGRQIIFYFQPIKSQAEFYAPTIAPLQWAERTMRTLTFAASGALDRTITLGFEASTEFRKAARRAILNTDGHASLIGEANPSLSLIPTTDSTEEKLFG